MSVFAVYAPAAQNGAADIAQAQAENGNSAAGTDDSDGDDSAPPANVRDIHSANEGSLQNSAQIRTQNAAAGEVGETEETPPQNAQAAASGNGGETPASAAGSAPAKPVVAEKLTPRQERLKNLLQKNPFGTVASSSADARSAQQKAEQTNGLELRAIYCVDGKWMFSISDSVTKTSYTIKLREPMSEKIPYMIDFYDDETNTVSISNNLYSFTLTLKTPDAPTGPAPKPAAISSAASAVKTAVKNTANANITNRAQTQPSQFRAYRNR